MIQTQLFHSWNSSPRFLNRLSVTSLSRTVKVPYRICISPSYVGDTPIFQRHAASGRGEAAAQRAGLGLPRAPARLSERTELDYESFVMGMRASDSAPYGRIM
jgi:hypothetical protein